MRLIRDLNWFFLMKKKQADFKGLLEENGFPPRVVYELCKLYDSPEKKDIISSESN
jgi:hypothetical protein